jgi:hypothetical protein
MDRPTTTMTLRSLLIMSLFALGCGKHLLGRDDLDASMFNHHNNLRWGRIANAAVMVQPEMREPFLRSWTAKLEGIELQDIEVVGVNETPDGADVIVRVTFVERATMTVKDAIISEKWIKTDEGWRVKEPATLEKS